MTPTHPAGEPRQPRDWASAALIAGCALVAILPLLLRGNSCGHDFDFHLQSWMDVARQWHEGTWYPRWVASANYGAGEPRLIFYPPASWLLGAALGVLLSWNAAPILFVLLSLLGCGFACYRLAREWLPPETARIAACLYLVNPYLLFVAYERGALAELLAGVWMPLVLLFALRRRPALAPLALSIAAVWLTNAPAAVMACYTVALLALLTALQERHWWPVLRAAGGTTLGIALAAFYIVPAAYERRWVAIDRAIGPGMRVEDSFLFLRTGEAFHDQVLRTASWIAVSLLLTATIAAWFAERRGLARTASRALTGLLALIGLLLVPISDLLWRHAPELKFLQFPWRWLLVVGVAAAVLLGMALPNLLAKAALRWLPSLAVLAIAALLTATASRLFWQPCDDEDAVSAQVRTFQAGDGFAGTDEYATRDVDNSAIQRGLPPVRLLAHANDDPADNSSEPNSEWTGSSPTSSLVDIRAWSTEHKAIRASSATSGFVVLRLMDYPAWHVSVNGAEIAARATRADGLLTLPITAGESLIDVKYQRTPDIPWGCGLSGAAILVLIALASGEKKRQRLRLS